MDATYTDAVIGERVHAAIWRARMTQTAVAKALGLDQAAINRRLRGTTPWKVTEILRLAELLRVGVGDLLPEGALREPVEQVNNAQSGSPRMARHASARKRRRRLLPDVNPEHPVTLVAVPG